MRRPASEWIDALSGFQLRMMRSTGTLFGYPFGGASPEQSGSHSS
jgi:hypothetical protein